MNGLGDLFGMGGPPGMTPEQQEYLKQQQMMGFFSKMAAASAPSTDPRSGSLGYALSQGIQGMGQARGPAMQQAMAADKFNAMRNQRARKKANMEELAAIRRNQDIPAAGPPTPQGIYPTAEGTTPRPMGDYLQEYAQTAMRKGDMPTAVAATGMIPKAADKPDVWQAWGHGQMRNTRTKEIKDIPTKPTGGVRGNEEWFKSARQWIKTMSESPDEWGLKQLNTGQASQAVEKLQKIKQGDPQLDSTTAANRAIREVLKEGKKKPAKIELPPAGTEVDITGNTVTYQGDTYNIDEFGEITIEGKKYKVRK